MGCFCPEQLPLLPVFHASRIVACLCWAHWPCKHPPWCLETSEKDCLSFWASQEQFPCPPSPLPHATSRGPVLSRKQVQQRLGREYVWGWGVAESQVELLMLDHVTELSNLWVKLTHNYMLLRTPSSTALNFFPSLFKLKCQRWHSNCWVFLNDGLCLKQCVRTRWFWTVF